MFGRVADGAVRLQAGARRQQRGIGGGCLGGADIARGVSRTVGECQGRPVDQRTREFQGDVHVGQFVLDGLVAADQPAELTALPGVGDGRVQHCLTRADQLGRGGQRAELEGTL